MTHLPGSGTFTPSTATPQHRAAGPEVIRAVILTISDTRTATTDTSGQYLKNELQQAGHELVEYLIVKDDAVEIRAALTRLVHRADLILTSGGTGIAGRDVTIPVVESMLVKPIPGFGELFRMLSYQQVRGAAMLSRATGGLTRGALLFAMPGSLNAVQTAWESILKDELRHLVFEVLRQGQPGSASPPLPATMAGPAAAPAMPPTPAGTPPVHPAPAAPGLLSTHINQGASAGIGRHAGVIGSDPLVHGAAGLGRHAATGEHGALKDPSKDTVKDDPQR
ncbi:MogA/MoaB family molybdenum cofactor biosynthesis protein [Deinococcus fonticola]|uniref:MogA/MoaB family molybdenum cofactor biosynthesis protein n=1 Tax=Deinococcus fonticola TaxID=2528713 RepID=UPI001075602E|nr:MogA/MoaB family molybdenum cofactor biosynthesis protein [Deinococcus fonticola]